MFDISNFPDLKRLGSGTQGVVFKAPAGMLKTGAMLHEAVAVKVYFPKTIANKETSVDEYISDLIALYKSLSAQTRTVIDHYFTWPKSVVGKNETICGHIMQLLPGRFFSSYTDCMGSVVPVESNYDFAMNSAETMRSIGMTALNRTGRFVISISLAHAAFTIHNLAIDGGNDVQQITMGDLSPNNIMVYIDPANQWHNSIMVIDVESFRLFGGSGPFNQPHTPSWFPPECIAAKEECRRLQKMPNPDQKAIRKASIMTYLQNEKTDIYKICLAILRMYHRGDDRMLITESPSALELMAREVNDRFARLIQAGLSTNPAIRPPMMDIYKELFVFNKRLRQR